MWYSKSSTSALLVMFIIKHMKMGTNIIEIKEEDFCLYANCSPKTFYNAIDAVIRPECNHPCTGDTLALLARTTKKGIYVVNHNFIYRGNYDEFVTIYEENFPMVVNLIIRVELFLINLLIKRSPDLPLW